MSSLNIWKKSAGVDNRVVTRLDSTGPPIPALPTIGVCLRGHLRYLLNLNTALMPIRIRIRLSILMPIQIRILPQLLRMLKNPNFFTFYLSLVSVMSVTMFNISDIILKFPLKIYSLSLLMVEMDPDPYLEPDRKYLDADPDPAKWCRSERIRILRKKNKEYEHC
jgi:hypothetical protein